MCAHNTLACQQSQKHLCVMLSHSLPHSPLLSLCSLFQFVGVEGLITGIMDMLPPKSTLGSLRREVVAAICCVICFLIDMSMVTEVEIGIPRLFILKNFETYSHFEAYYNTATISFRYEMKGQSPFFKLETVFLAHCLNVSLKYMDCAPNA